MFCSSSPSILRMSKNNLRFMNSMGFSNTQQWLKVKRVSLFLSLLLSPTQSIHNSYIQLEMACVASLLSTDAQELKLASLSASSHIQSSLKTSHLCILVENSHLTFHRNYLSCGWKAGLPTNNIMHTNWRHPAPFKTMWKWLCSSMFLFLTSCF